VRAELFLADRRADGHNEVETLFTIPLRTPIEINADCSNAVSNNAHHYLKKSICCALQRWIICVFYREKNYLLMLCELLCLRFYVTGAVFAYA
jgi:hypothetical protein